MVWSNIRFFKLDLCFSFLNFMKIHYIMIIDTEKPFYEKDFRKKKSFHTKTSIPEEDEKNNSNDDSNNGGTTN